MKHRVILHIWIFTKLLLVFDQIGFENLLWILKFEFMEHPQLPSPASIHFDFVRTLTKESSV